LSKESLEVSIEERPDYTDSRKITGILNSETSCPQSKIRTGLPERSVYLWAMKYLQVLSYMVRIRSPPNKGGKAWKKR
jgi:hypothetical protein